MLRILAGMIIVWGSFQISSPMVWGQPLDSGESPPTSQETATDKTENGGELPDILRETTRETGEFVAEKSEELRQKLDESEEARKYSAGILQPIYAMAEYMAFAWFHWVAFALMVSGVVSFALQLVLGKLVVLVRGGFSFAEILGDAQCLLISLVGLFLTTQAATENSNFTSSAGAVLTSTVVGGIVGLLFYLWGQSAELEALRGRREELQKAQPRK